MDFVMAFVIGATLNLLRFKLSLMAHERQNASYRERGLRLLTTTLTIHWRMVTFNTILAGLLTLVAYYIWTIV